MEITKEVALKVWDDLFPGKEWAMDCYGYWMCRSCWSKEAVFKIRPGNTKSFDYSWNIDHIRPKASFSDESDADIYGNFEPVHRLNNLEKSDNYPTFDVKNHHYKVVNDLHGGYGILDSSGNRIDRKGQLHVWYE